MTRRRSQEEVAALFSNANLKLLGTYERMGTPVLSKCRTCGSKQEVWLGSVLRGRPCPECQRQDMERKVSQSFAGQNLVMRGAFTSVKKKVLTRCLDCGHEWRVVPRSIQEGTGCPKCPRLSVEEIDSRFAKKGLKRLGEFQNITKKVLTRCLTCGYEWHVRPNTVSNGSGCYRCRYTSVSRHLKGKSRIPQERVHAAFDKVGLDLLDYKNTKSLAHVQCRSCERKMHIDPCNVLFKGYGCRYCSPVSLPEEEVRALMEKMTGWRFPKVKPSWLRGHGPRSLELDGYNKRHAVAFEYQGIRHYEPINGEQQFHYMKRNDNRKRMLCQRHGILLIRIPYWKRDIEGFVRAKMEKAGLL